MDPIGIVCPMPMELRPLRRPLGLRRAGAAWAGTTPGGRAVRAVVSGMGTALARTATGGLLDSGTVAHVVVVGIAGAVDDEMPIGSLVLPEVVVDAASGREHRPARLGTGAHAGRLWTSDALTTDAGALADLRAAGVVALDMETSAVAEVCEQRGVPWSVFRAISDRATDGSVDAHVLAMSNQDGTPNPRAIARYVVRNPTRVRHLARLGRQSSLAASRAAAAALAALAAN